MKKIMILFFMLIYIFSIKSVFAQQEYHLTLEKQDGIYFSRKGANFSDDSYPYYIYRFGNMYAYCLQPGKHFKTYDYVGMDNFVDLSFSDEVKEQLELIGHFGRDYPGHDNVRYSMAAQALIWELTGVDTVTYWTEQYEQGQEIDVTAEKNEIMSLVNKAKLFPNISNNITGNLNREISIVDSNKILENYEIENTSANLVSISGNTLKIIPKVIGDATITLNYKKYDDLKTIIFVGKDNSDSQILGRLRLSIDKKMTINLKVNGIKILVNKVNDLGERVTYRGIAFKIKDLSTNSYICENDNCKYYTNDQGLFTTKDLGYGTYEIEEPFGQFMKGLIRNSGIVRVTINEDTPLTFQDGYNNVVVNFVNNRFNSKIFLYKKGEKAVFTNNKITYESIMLDDVEFDLYQSNQFMGTIKSNSNGPAMEYAPIGILYAIEKTELPEYVQDKSKHEFWVQQSSSEVTESSVTVNIQNNLKKGTLEFSKVDDKTNIGIADTVIEIYNENNELLLTKTTDASGKVIINNFPYGKYYILEKQANDMYQKNDEKLFFEIKENGKTVNVKMTNKKATGYLELTKYGEKLIIKDGESSYQNILLPNISFDLYNEHDELIDTLTTDNNGYVKKELELGKYYVKERNELSNYQDNNEKYSFEIKKNENEVIDAKLNINNYLKKGKIEFIKEDYYTGEGISDTVIEIYNENNELLFTKTTNEKGKVIINNLPLGKYYVVEKEANYFYQKTDEKKYFEIKQNNETVKKKLTNKKIVGDLEIIKHGEKYLINDNDISYEKKVLPNIEFSLYDENNNLIGILKTDKNGYYKYANLPIGKYYLIEKTNLNNYINDAKKIPFEITKDGDTGKSVQLVIDNYLKKGSVEFTKIDLATGEGIPNTIIEIYDEKNNLLLSRETDELGKVIINNLPTGRYYILEKEANLMYQITNEKVYFEIKDDGEIVKAKMTNEKITIPVPKTNTKESIIVYSIFGISILIGIGRFCYERKETF